MNNPEVQVRELAAWGLDDYAYRPLHCEAVAGDLTVPLPTYEPVVAGGWNALRERMALQATRPDLLKEMHGLEWSLEVIDLRALLSFQRRLQFNPGFDPRPQQDLLEVCFGKPQRPLYDVERIDARTLTLRSSNPNLQIELLAGTPFVSVSCGSPFLEVGAFQGRWFLRDGYHRAYQLLRQAITMVPAVVVQAQTLEELGATRPWFFAEAVLFSERPPRLLDFLNDSLTITYTRPVLTKSLRITIDESYTPQSAAGDDVTEGRRWLRAWK